MEVFSIVPRTLGSVGSTGSMYLQFFLPWHASYFFFPAQRHPEPWEQTARKSPKDPTAADTDKKETLRSQAPSLRGKKGKAFFKSGLRTLDLNIQRKQ